MAKQKYVIRQISALGIISSSKGENGDRRFFFDATDTSKEYLVEETKQDDCPMFYQAMRLLHGEGFRSSALEEGPLRTEEYVLPDETKQKLAALDIPDKLRRYAEDMTAFYYANKQDDCEYVVFPAANFKACYGSTTFSKKKLPQLPQSVFDREERHGLCRLKVIL